MQRQHTSAPSDASRTITIEQTGSEPSTSTSTQTNQAGTIRLRGRAMPGVKVQWNEEVIDNEFLGRKKSKICCIYHKPKAFDESSGEDSDSSCGSTDSSRRRHHHVPHNNHDAPGPNLREGGESATVIQQPSEGALEDAKSDLNAYDKPSGTGTGKGKGKS